MSPKQARFLDATEPVRGFVAGQGSGKSIVGAYDLLQRALPDRTYMVTGPTYKVLAQATAKTFADKAREFGRLVRLTRSTDNPSALIRVHPARGRGLAEVLFRSTENPDHLRGPNISGIWMDEASLSPLEAYQILVARLREKGERGWLSATFTPKGLTHWTCEVFGKQRPGVFLIHARTEENPFLPPEFITLLHQTYTGLRAEQELGGEFVAVEGAEWPAEYFPESIFFDDWPALPWAATALALDPSKGKDASKPKEGKPPDYSAFVWGAVDGTGCVWVDADLDNTRDVMKLVQDGLAHWRAFNPRAFVIEVNQFQALLGHLFFEEARKLSADLPPLWGVDNHEPKPVRIRAVGPFLARRQLRVRDTPGGRLLVAQLRDFPQGVYDDGPDALEQLLRMLVYLIRGGTGANQPRALRV